MIFLALTILVPLRIVATALLEQKVGIPGEETHEDVSDRYFVDCHCGAGSVCSCRKSANRRRCGIFVERYSFFPPDQAGAAIGSDLQAADRESKAPKLPFRYFRSIPDCWAAIFGGVDQLEKTPPEWGKGAGAYGERVGSNFGIAMVTTTTRYALAEALREDTLYYRCECKGVVRRLGHAVISTVTARYGDQGYRRLSFAAIVAPYAGSMTAVYGWYPNSYGAKDGLRMGSYALLAFGAGNIAQEFIYGGSHTLFGRGNRSASPGTDTLASSNP